jgi:4'-phosphopantetheinyl transferase
MIPGARRLAAPAGIDLWLLDLTIQVDAAALRNLSTAECQRANSFRFERDRQRFLARRGLLRELLARQVDTAPAALQFTAGALGKPVLLSAPCHFSTSHSGDMGLVAMSLSDELGVDIEAVRALPDLAELARSQLTAAEFESFIRLDPSARLPAFMAAWTRKEACLKALGVGLSVEPQTVSVGLGWGSGVVVVEAGVNSSRVDLSSIDTAPGFLAALARRSSD